MKDKNGKENREREIKMTSLLVVVSLRFFLSYKKFLSRVLLSLRRPFHFRFSPTTSLFSFILTSSSREKDVDDDNCVSLSLLSWVPFFLPVLSWFNCNLSYLFCRQTQEETSLSYTKRLKKE